MKKLLLSTILSTCLLFSNIAFASPKDELKPLGKLSLQIPCFNTDTLIKNLISSGFTPRIMAMGGFIPDPDSDGILVIYENDMTDEILIFSHTNDDITCLQSYGYNMSKINLNKISN